MNCLSFKKKILESLCQPLESGFVHIARARRSLIFPAKFSLFAAMNPCPCGYYGDVERECACSAYEVIKYQKKISGPLLDRIDIQIKVGKVKINELRGNEEPHQNSFLRNDVLRVRDVQVSRFSKEKIKLNAEMSSKDVDRFVPIPREADDFIQSLDKKLVSPRGYYRILKVARTIADLDGVDFVTVDHLAEAFSYRLRDGF
jgi:magnesium chelatase family protein